MFLGTSRRGSAQTGAANSKSKGMPEALPAVVLTIPDRTDRNDGAVKPMRFHPLIAPETNPAPTSADTAIQALVGQKDIAVTISSKAAVEATAITIPLHSDT